MLRDYADGAFLGDASKPPSELVALHHDFQQISLLKLSEQTKLNPLQIVRLEAPICRLFQTPWNQGRVLLYELKTVAAPQLRATNNLDSGADPFDFNVSKSAAFKMQFD